MAEFNPQTPDIQAPNFTGLSQGTGVNKSFEELFSGLGNIVGSVAQTGDNYVKQSIQNDVRYGFDTATQQSGLAAGGPGGLPPELTQSQASLQKLAAAQVQGKITPEYYYAQLSNTMKGLRAKYPGYEQDVDNIFQQVTGQNPANVFRDQLLRNINQANEALQSSASKDQTFVRENGPKVLSPAEMGQTATSGNYSAAIPIILQRQAAQAQQAALIQQVKDQPIMAAPVFNSSVNGMVQTTLSQAGSIAGIKTNNFGQILAQAAKGGTGLSDDQIGVLSGQLDQQMDAIRTKAAALRAQPGFDTLDISKSTADVEAALTPLKELQTALHKKDYSTSAMILAQNENSIQTATSSLLKQYPAWAGISAISKMSPTLGQVAAQDWINKHAMTPGGFVDSVMSGNMAAAAVNGDVPIQSAADAIKNNPNWTTAQKSSRLQQTIDGYRTFFSTVPQDPDTIRKAVSANYGASAQQDSLWQVVNRDQRLQLFNTMYDPQITKKIAASGDQQAIQQYARSAMDHIQSVSQFSETAADLSQGLDAAKFVHVAFDPKTNQLRLSLDPSVAQGANPTALNGYYSGLNKFASDFNQGLATMGPIWDAAGMDKTQGVQQLLQNWNTQIGGGKTSGLLGWIQSKISPDTTGQTGTERQSSAPKPGDIPLGSPTDQAAPVPLQFSPDALSAVKSSSTSPSALLNVISRAEGTDEQAGGSGYNDTLGHGLFTGKVALTGMTISQVMDLQKEMLQQPGNTLNSSAVGRYQIVGSTLRDLVRQGVASPDDLFDQATQDKLASALVDQSGYDEWKKGTLSDAEFSHRLAGQWASLADTSGRTYYRGQSRVGATADEVLNAAQQ